VIIRPSRAEARAAATASAVRYPVNDGAGRTVAITSDCLPLTCNSADPPTIANFLGTLPHGDEMNLLTVNLVPAIEISAQCGSVEAQACYYPGENRMVINGDDTPASDGASRAYVIAHEYGHHLANHRNNSPFDDPAIDWGPKNWASFAGVCQGVRAGRYFPGAEVPPQYFDNPGEAFAESFAHNRFPNDPVPWEWPDFPDPSPGAFPAIQRDALDPWNGDSVDKRRGHFPEKRRPKKMLKKFATPLDGDLKLSLSGPDRADLALKLRNSDGHILARSDGVGSHESVSYQICGERSVSAVVRRHGRRLYLVGGYLRDLLLESALTDKDVDLATDAAPDATLTIVRHLGWPTYEVGKRFGTIGLSTETGTIEVTTFRKDVYRADDRHPEVTFGDDILEDLIRRDLTINSLAVNLTDGPLLDPAGGIRDLRRQRIRITGDPAQRFAEDPLRLMRVVRFAAQLGFQLDDGNEAAGRRTAAKCRSD